MACAVTSFRERFQEGDAAFGSDGWKRTRSFRATVSEAAYNASEVVLSHADCPKVGDRYSAGAGQCVASIKCELLDAACSTAFKITVEYADPNSAGFPDFSQDSQTPPWEEAPVYSYDFINYQKPLEKDKSSSAKAVLNSANDPFDNAPMYDSANMKISISRNTRNYSPATAWFLTNKLNAEAVAFESMTIPPGKARLLRWAGSDAVWTDADGDDHAYYQEQIEIELTTDEEGFSLCPLDCGFRTLDKTPIKDSEGNAVTSPALLNGSGGVSTTPVFLSFVAYKSASWSNLAL